jgi:transposase-like protein
MKKYEAGLKKQILAMISAGRDPKELSKEYGVPGVTISNWRRASDDPKVKPSENPQKDEIKALKAENLQLRMEIDILKKAAAIILKK